MLQSVDSNVQSRWASHTRVFDSGIVSDDLLLITESLAQERTYRLRDLLDSLMLEGERVDVHELVRMIHETHAEVHVSLTARERDVLFLLATGASNCEIADMLKVTVNTIKTHLNGVYSKLNVHSRLEAIARARELDLL